MEAADLEAAFKPAHLVILSPIPSPTLNPRRLSSQFTKPSSPVRAGTRKKSASPLAWVSLQGRLVGAEDATSTRTIGGGLNQKEAVAWELFSPIHRVLIVAVVAVVTTKCHKNRQIAQLKKCVQLRDDILMSMQQKLDDLCDQMNCMKDQPQALVDKLPLKMMDSSSRRSSLSSKTDSICTDCWFCDQRRAESNDFLGSSLVKTASSGDELFRNRLSISNEAEQEERRMSDLSDWASSVSSVADIQLNNLAVEQDTYNLKRECEEKDAAIKELSAFIRSKDVATSKRIEDLEEVIRRKNTLVTKLKKDLIVLEQKVVNLTRTRRRSFPGPSLEKKQLPTMSDNLLYDMDSPLSSDSDCTSEKQNTSSAAQSEAVVKASVNTQLQSSFSCENNVTKRSQNAKVAPPSTKLSLQVSKSRSVSPLKEKSLNQTHSSAAYPRINQVPASVGGNRRRTHSVSKDAAPQKRWI